jgi:thiol-disulfide isomerase/thioredoxin
MDRKTVLILLGISIVVVAAFKLNPGKGLAPVPAQSNSDLIDSQSNPTDLSSFKGKVVFINNWASWCPPCIAEMPSIQQLKNKLKGEKIVFVMVSFDEDQDKATAFMKKKGYDFQVYYPGKKYSFATESIPATFILDKTGEPVTKHTGMTDFNSESVIKAIRMAISKE